MKTSTVARRSLKKYQCGFCETWHEESDGYDDSEYGWQEGTTAAQARKSALRCEAGHWDFDNIRKAARAVVRKLSFAERLKRLQTHLNEAKDNLERALRERAEYRAQLRNLPGVIAAQQKAYDAYMEAERKREAERKARGDVSGWDMIICGTSSSYGPPKVESLAEAEASIRRSMEYNLAHLTRTEDYYERLSKRAEYLRRRAAP